MASYSKYNTRFYVDPELESWAGNIINKMGNNFLLEGACYANLETKKDVRLWYRDIAKDASYYQCKIFPVGVLEQDVNKIINEETKMVFLGYDGSSKIIDAEYIKEKERKDPIENKHDDKFEFIKL